MLFYTIPAVLLSVAYVVIIILYLKGWKAIPTWQVPKGFIGSTPVSILIPARNEAGNIVRCIQSVRAQNYPGHLVEIIVIDDHSEDETPLLVEALPYPNIQLLRLADFIPGGAGIRSFKKKAIEVAVGQAKGELIITTDADCVMSHGWLAMLVAYYEKTKAKFIAAPVNFHKERNVLECFQSLDFIGMMGVTGAGIQGRFMHMCNGANLAYPKTAFAEVKGFEGIDHLASGDDMLLMQKIAARFPGQTGFVKSREATVFTRAKPTWGSFISQRIRWASKSAAYPEIQVTLILGVVFFFCLSIFGSLLAAVFWGVGMLYLFMAQLLVKGLADYVFLNHLTRFFGRKDLMGSFFPALILHTLYIVAVGVAVNFRKEYEWKGRKVR